jgi:hypothetical protein
MVNSGAQEELAVLATLVTPVWSNTNPVVNSAAQEESSNATPVVNSRAQEEIAVLAVSLV